MALIKKQVFLRSRDENLQQFLAKASSHKGLEQRWGQPSAKNKPNTRARAQGLLRRGESQEAKSKSLDPRDPSGVDHPGEVQDRDLPDQGWDNSNSAQKEYVEKSQKAKWKRQQEEEHMRSESYADEQQDIKDDMAENRRKWKRQQEDEHVRSESYADEQQDIKDAMAEARESGRKFNPEAFSRGESQNRGGGGSTGVEKAVWDAYFEKQESYLTRGKDESDEEWWKRLKEEEDMKDEARWDEQAERDQAADEKEMDEWADYEEDMRNQGPPDIDENQNESDAPSNVKKAVWDAYVEKADKVNLSDLHRSKVGQGTRAATPSPKIQAALARHSKSDLEAMGRGGGMITPEGLVSAPPKDRLGKPARNLRKAIRDAWFEKQGTKWEDASQYLRDSKDTVEDREYQSRVALWRQGHPKGFAPPKWGESHEDWKARSNDPKNTEQKGAGRPGAGEGTPAWSQKRESPGEE